MFKKILMALVVICIMVASFGARANDFRVFQKSAGENWPAFSSRLTSEGTLKDGIIQTSVLDVFAYDMAKAKKIIPADVNDVIVFPEFSRAFRQLNGLGDTISEAEFKALGTGKGIYLPQYQGQGAQASVLPSEQKTLKDPTTQVEMSTVATVDPKQMALIRAELKRLGAEISKVRKELKAGDAKLAGSANREQMKLIAQIEEVKGQLDKLPKTAEVEVIADEVKTLSGSLTEMKKLLETQQEQGKSISMLWLAVGGLLFVPFALHFFTRRRVSVVESEVSTTRMGIDIIRREVTNIDEHVAEVEDRVASLEDELIPGNTLVMTRNEAGVLVDWLSSRAVGEEHTHICRLQDGTQYRIRFTRAEGEYVTIRGIRDQQEKNQVGIRNVPTRLRTAAKKGQFIDKWMLEVVAQAA